MFQLWICRGKQENDCDTIILKAVRQRILVNAAQKAGLFVSNTSDEDFEEVSISGNTESFVKFLKEDIVGNGFCGLPIDVSKESEDEIVSLLKKNCIDQHFEVCVVNG